MIFRKFFPKTGKWGVFNREPLPDHRLPEKEFIGTERLDRNTSDIYKRVKGFNMC